MQTLQPPRVAPNQSKLVIAAESSLRMGKVLGSGAFGTVYEVSVYSIAYANLDIKWMYIIHLFVVDHFVSQNQDACVGMNSLSQHGRWFIKLSCEFEGCLYSYQRE